MCRRQTVFGDMQSWLQKPGIDWKVCWLANEKVHSLARGLTLYLLDIVIFIGVCFNAFFSCLAKTQMLLITFFCLKLNGPLLFSIVRSVPVKWLNKRFVVRGPVFSLKSSGLNLNCHKTGSWLVQPVVKCMDFLIKFKIFKVI